MTMAAATTWPVLERARTYLRQRLRPTPDYQPDPFDRSADSQRALRSCADRFDAIAARLPQGALSVLDVGCHLGYFTFRLAERGGICVGVDRSAAAVALARSRAQRHRIRNAAFVELDLDPAATAGLPATDVVLCLSVFHHWVRQFGQAGAMEMLTRVAGLARRTFVFETGQPEEADMKWAPQLDFMRPDSATWARATLTRLGLTADHAGAFPSGVSQGHRHLFVAHRIPSL